MKGAAQKWARRWSMRPRVVLLLAAATAWTSGARAQSRPPASATTSVPAPASPALPPAPPAPSASPPPGDKLFAEALRAYHAALLSRRLGQQDLRKEDVAARVAEGEELMATGRVDEAIARLGELVEHPQFDLFAESEDGRAATFRLGDALATA